MTTIQLIFSILLLLQLIMVIVVLFKRSILIFAITISVCLTTLIFAIITNQDQLHIWCSGFNTIMQSLNAYIWNKNRRLYE